MKEYVKYIAWIIVAIVVLVLIFKISNLIEGPAHVDYTVSTPIDSGFVPIIEKDYKPRSTPFERPSKPPVKLPKGVKESDVKRAIVVVDSMETGSGRKFLDTTTVIELKSGEIFVPKKDGKELSVEEYSYKPPILAFGLFGSLGASLGQSAGKLAVSPIVGASLAQISGLVQFPLFSADFDGIGAGIGLRYGSVMVGAHSHWRFDGTQRQIKLSLQFCIN